jgi:hypothetical protein
MSQLACASIPDSEPSPAGPSSWSVRAPSISLCYCPGTERGDLIKALSKQYLLFHLRIPSLSPAGAFLALSASFDAGNNKDQMPVMPALRPPWCWPAWQSLTGISSDSNPLTLEYNPDAPWGSPKDNGTVQAFTCNFWALSDQDQTTYIRVQDDNDSDG